MSSYSNSLELIVACKNGDLGKVKQLLGTGIDVNSYASDGMTPILMSVFSGNEEIIKLLLKAGADPNIKDEEGRTPLGAAISFNKKGLVNILLENGANISFLNEAEVATAKAFGIDLGERKKHLSDAEKQIYKNFADGMREILMQDPTKGLEKSFDSIDRKMENFGNDMEAFNKNEDRVISGLIKPVSFIVLFVVVLILILWR